MKQENMVLSITSLLSVLLVLFHVTDDIVHGMEPGTATNLTTVPILVVWLYGTLVLAERRSGYIIMLLGSLLAMVMPVTHIMGRGVGGEFARSDGAFFFISTLLALGVTGLFSAILSVRALWSLQRGQPQPR
jgi:hypothetical protein